MRRTQLLLPVLLVVLAACGRDQVLLSATPLRAPLPAAVLRIADPTGVSLLDTEAGSVLTRIPRAVRSRHWVFQAQRTAEGTTLLAVNGAGDTVWQRDVDGDLAARIASADGSRVAMLPMDHANVDVDPYHPVGRSTTALTVVPTDGRKPRTYELAGNFEPEAFSTSGRSLFVVEYVPPQTPESYRVRKLDLATGEIGAVYSVDGHLQESMRGTARVQAMSADGSRLYTLYTTDDGTAFVHVLDLDEEWAHCIDLPAPIGSSPEQLLAITAAPEGDRVVVVDALAGVAELDTASLTVDRTVDHFADATQAGRALAILDRDGDLLTGIGTSLTVLRPDLSHRTRWAAPAAVRGLYLDPKDDRVWALGAHALYALDPETGEVLDAVALPDDMPPVDLPAPFDPLLQCAC